MSTSEGQRLFTAPEIARRAGVSPETIRNWTKRASPLETVRTPDGRTRHTWALLIEFCESNPGLQKAAGVLRRAKVRENPPPALQEPSTSTAAQLESLKSLARDLRTAAQTNLEAVRTAARLAEETARAHREQLDQLAMTFAAYDSALSQLTAPETMHD
jgi:hypothetical protein